MKLVADKRSRRKSERPLEITSAALELFLTKGYAATTLTEIATRAGIAKGTLFLYFQCKSDLFQSVIEREISELQKLLIDDFIGKGTSTREQLDALFVYWHQSNALTRAARLLRLIASVSSEFPQLLDSCATKILTPAKQKICDFFHRGIERKELKYFDYQNEASVVMASLAMMSTSSELPLVYCIKSAPIDPLIQIKNLATVITEKYTTN